MVGDKRMDDIFSDIGRAAEDATDFLERAERADRTRRCEWDGQSADGRKRREDLGREAFPWEGASDVRARLVDEICNEQVALMLQAFMRARVQVAATEYTDTAWAGKVTTILKHVVWTKMRGQVRRELALAAQWRQSFGCAVTAVMWDQELRRMEQEVTVEGLGALLARSRPARLAQPSSAKRQNRQPKPQQPIQPIANDDQALLFSSGTGAPFRGEAAGPIWPLGGATRPPLSLVFDRRRAPIFPAPRANPLWVTLPRR
jgi:hypothetical protein